MTITRINFHTAMRAAAVQLLGDYRSAADINLQIYPGRPKSVYPPCAFVDRMTGTDTPTGMSMRQQNVGCEVVVLHGLYDSKEAVDQRDGFVDGFGAYVIEQFHAAGANTLISSASYEDDPSYVPDWIEEQRTYFATRITLEGFANN